MATQKIKIAVLPVAGLGTRVMPLTLHQPKAMIGIVDRPMIHYVIDEIVSAGIKHIVIVTGPNQPEFKKYIDLLENDKHWKKLGIRFDFAVQKNLRGNGDAVFAAEKFIKNKPFLVCFSDDLLADNKSPMKTLVSLYEKTNSPVIVLESVPLKIVHRYGVVKAKPEVKNNLYKIFDVVEKPRAEDAPSRLTIIGRYVLTPAIFKEIGKLYQYTYKGKEIGIADALRNYARSGGELYGWLFRGKRFDAGSKIGLLQAQIYFGMRHKELGPEFKRFISSTGKKRRKAA